MTELNYEEIAELQSGDSVVSWDLSETADQDDISIARRRIRREAFLIRPKVYRRDCWCTFKSRGRHSNFYECWFYKIKEFIEKQKMTDYVDEMTLVHSINDTRAIRIVCTVRAVQKLIIQGPNIIGASRENRK